MKTTRHYQQRYDRRTLIITLLLAWLLAGCTAMAPKPEQLQLPAEQPVETTTAFSDALGQLGTQSVIYGADLFKIQCREVDDDTGTSYHTGGEIPKTITLMVNSALNAIGGRVVYIPYWPDYFAGIQVSGYPTSNQKLVPDVVLAGGITEFDRALVTVDRSRNLDFETKEHENAPDWFDGKTIGLDYSEADKWSRAKIAVDFNLVSFEAQFGIPKMQASNAINVYKGVKEGELGFTLYGPTFGLRGSVKKVQGRHDAVRILVQASVIQLVGRYLDLPYWQLLDGSKPDPVVMENLRINYLRKDPAQKALALKRLLWLHGHPATVKGPLDADAKAALAQIDSAYDGLQEPVPVETFLSLYLSVPVNALSLERGNQFDRELSQYQAALEQEALKNRPAPVQPPKQEKRTIRKRNHRQKKDRPEGEKPKATEQPQQTPKHDVIIITPLDTKTRNSLGRIVRRIESKRRNSVGVKSINYPTMLYESRIATVRP